MQEFKKILVSLFIWTFILFTMLPFFVLYMVIWILVFPFDHKNKVTHFFTGVWTRIYLTFNPGWRLKVENRDKINHHHPYILIANHQSIIDIALLLQLQINFKWVSKIELAGVPFVGWVIWMNDHILVRRGDKKSVEAMAEACKRTLKRGISIFMFPEGTRTGNGKIQTFKEGAFILAKENRVPILPVVIDGSGDALPRKGLKFGINQTFTVRVLDEITVERIDSLPLQQLMDYARETMTEELNRVRKIYLS